MAIDTDDIEPQVKKPFKPKDLTTFSVEDLEDYIARLNDEIARARAAIEAKRAFRNAAETFFKK
jgi:uncharacterized small protein (DUF1192 family)